MITPDQIHLEKSGMPGEDRTHVTASIKRVFSVENKDYNLTPQAYDKFYIRRVWGDCYEEIRRELMIVMSQLKNSDTHNFEIDNSIDRVETLLLKMRYPE